MQQATAGNEDTIYIPGYPQILYKFDIIPQIKQLSI